MKVILVENVKNLGHTLDQVQVKRGFARYLINYKKAVYATKENIDLVQKNQDMLLVKKYKVEQEAQSICEVLNNIQLCFIKKAQENKKLFGSVNQKDILNKIKDYLQSQNVVLNYLKLSTENINLNQIIRTIGVFTVKIDLGYKEASKTTNVIVNVASSENEAANNINKFYQDDKNKLDKNVSQDQLDQNIAQNHKSDESDNTSENKLSNTNE